MRPGRRASASLTGSHWFSSLKARVTLPLCTQLESTLCVYLPAYTPVLRDYRSPPTDTLQTYVPRLIDSTTATNRTTEPRAQSDPTDLRPDQRARLACRPVLKHFRPSHPTNQPGAPSAPTTVGVAQVSFCLCTSTTPLSSNRTAQLH